MLIDELRKIRIEMDAEDRKQQKQKMDTLYNTVIVPLFRKQVREGKTFLEYHVLTTSLYDLGYIKKLAEQDGLKTATLYSNGKCYCDITCAI